MDRSKFLIGHGSSANAWAKRYQIEPFSHPCGDCGTTLTTSLPFAHRHLRGLIAPVCDCGNDRTPYAVVSSEGRTIADLFR